MRTIYIVVEKNDGLLWGIVEGKSRLFTPTGETSEKLIENFKQLVNGYIVNEGDSDKEWSVTNWNKTTIILE